ncbi:Myelin-associated neurite-outgrowth inhibitor [Manis javanica]|nr:Myelin-associated neurite-outgrowth inhibitor [Manis javanica]
MGGQAPRRAPLPEPQRRLRPGPARWSPRRRPPRRVLEIMNPVYSPGSSGVPYANAKGIGYPAGFPMGYAAAAPAYSPSMYPGANPTFQTGYSPGAPYKVSCSPTSGAVPPYSPSPNPYQTAVYPVRSAYPQQSPYAQQGTYYTQPLYAAPPHVIHHTTVVQPNGMPATVYPAPIPPPRGNGVTMGMVAGTTMAMSAGTLLTAHSPTPLCAPPVVITLQRFKEGTGGSHGGSTAGAAGCVPPTRTFFVMLSTLS